MDLNEIERLLAMMKEHDILEVELEDPENGTRLRLRKSDPCARMNSQPGIAPGVAMTPAMEAPRAMEAQGQPAQAEEAGAERTNLTEVPSPMVGTFYRASSPDSEPFVEVGDHIGDESVVCIIEAMKVMNEIKAEVSGEVMEILVNNGEAVEFGQPLFLIRTE